VSKLLKIWRARGDLNARPLVPEFSENWLSCWFALLSVLACYLVFPAVRLLLFRNCSEIFTIDSNGCKVFIRDGISRRLITAFLPTVELISPGSVPKTLRGVSAWLNSTILETFRTCNAEIRNESITARWPPRLPRCKLGRPSRVTDAGPRAAGPPG
jgi:hypothetical protein